MEFLLQLIAELFAGTPEEEKNMAMESTEAVATEAVKEETIAAEAPEVSPNIFNVIHFR